MCSVRKGDWEEAPFEGDGEETNAQDRRAVGREGDSDEGPDAETRAWCGCETRGDAGRKSEDSMDLRWFVEYVWEKSKEEGCTRHLPERR